MSVMTKEKMEEKIISLLGYCNEATINSINDIFEEFARTNVCIPKGENRHPHADVLHAFAEGASVQYCFNGLHYEWLDTSSPEWSRNVKLRIKPSEPIYEWQWCVIMNDGTGSIHGYHTTEGINELFPKRNKFKIEATKRERK